MCGADDDLVRAVQDDRRNLQGLCGNCHAQKTEREFPGSRAFHGAKWARRKAARSSTTPQRLDRCPVCGAGMEFDEIMADFACQWCDPGIADDGGEA